MRKELILETMKGKFIVQEFVSKKVYDLLGDEAIHLLNPFLIRAVCRLKDVYPGKIIHINNWFWRGNSENRGFREQSSPVGVKNSQHKLGEALDFVISGISSEEVRRYIKDHPNEFPGIHRMEKDVSWVHIDTKKTRNGEIYEFSA